MKEKAHRLESRTSSAAVYTIGTLLWQGMNMIHVIWIIYFVAKQFMCMFTSFPTADGIIFYPLIIFWGELLRSDVISSPKSVILYHIYKPVYIPVL